MDKTDLKKYIAPAVGGVAAGLATLAILKAIAAKLRSSNTSSARKIAVFYGDQGKVFEVGTDFRAFVDQVANHFNLGSVVLVSPEGAQATTLAHLQKHELFVIDEGANLLPIPDGPPPYPIVGNLPQLTPEMLIRLIELSKIYGTVWKFTLPKVKAVFLAEPDLVQEVIANPDKFPKKVKTGVLYQLRHLAGDGLFTASDDEENWALAHRILMPAFSGKAIKAYIPTIVTATYKCLKAWDHYKPEDDVDFSSWMTKMTFDTIGLCGFGYDFQSLSVDKEVKFIGEMIKVLKISQKRVAKTDLGKLFPSSEDRDYFETVKDMQAVVYEVLEARKKMTKEEQLAKGDLLSLMLNARDPQTGKGLSDQNIVYQVLTFLIAGHETTSNLLSWTFLLLSQSPNVEMKALEEVDRVLDSDVNSPPTEKQIQQLKYIPQILKEALRLYPPAPAFGKIVEKDGTKLGPYRVDKGTVIINSVYALHRHPKYWKNPDTFDPDNFAPENVVGRHPYCYLPFSTGPRACIGMQFALLEATVSSLANSSAMSNYNQIFVAMVLKQKLVRLSPASNPKLSAETITLRPKGLVMRIHTRDRNAHVSHVTLSSTVKPIPAPAPVVEVRTEMKQTVLPSALAADTPPLVILFGSNTGTSEEAAYQLAYLAKKEGFKTTAVAPLDSYFEKLGHEPVPLLIVVTSTYNGNPPDNASKFDKWLDEAVVTCPHMLKGTKFAVFGIGNSQWQSYQAFPNKIDTKLSQLSATRVYARGEGDVAQDYEEAFMDWKPRLFQTLRSLYSDDSKPLQVAMVEEAQFKSNLVIEYQADEAEETAHVSPMTEARCCTVLASRELQSNSSDRHTRHLEFALPDDVTYTTGDHLGVCPVNEQRLVEVMAKRLGVEPKRKVKLSISDPTFQSKKSTLPLNAVTTVQEILARFIDLNVAPNRPALKVFSQYCSNSEQQRRLALLANPEAEGIEAYKAYFNQDWKTMIDVFNDFPAINVPLDVFLEVSPKLQPRFYSISSSNATSPHIAHVTVGLVDDEITPNKHYHGVCSSFLNGLQTGDKAFVFVQDTKTTFRVPTDPNTTMIMICAGTGLAPFRGFMHERRHLKETQGHVGKSYLFFGCRRPEYDYLYQDELAQLKADGVLTDVFTAFSRKVPTKKEYVQDKLLQHKELVWELIKDSDPTKCIVYVCGSARGMAKDVRLTFAKIAEELLPEQIANRFVAAMQEKGAYLEDIWG